MHKTKDIEHKNNVLQWRLFVHFNARVDEPLGDCNVLLCCRPVMSEMPFISQCHFILSLNSQSAGIN